MFDFVNARHLCSYAVVADIQISCPSLRLYDILTNVHKISYSMLVIHHVIWVGWAIAVISFVISIDMLLAIMTIWFAIGGALPLFTGVFSLIRGIFTQYLQGQVNHMRIDAVWVKLLKRLSEGEVLWHRLSQTGRLIKHSNLRWWVASGLLLLFH